jgi:hypothetical protein
MDKLDIILWVLGGGFALMLVMWHSLTSRFDKLEEKVTDIDRRLCRLEGAFTSKDCCRLGDERILKRTSE